jgi:hypothetical protein
MQLTAKNTRSSPQRSQCGVRYGALAVESGGAGPERRARWRCSEGNQPFPYGREVRPCYPLIPAAPFYEERILILILTPPPPFCYIDVRQ